MHALSSTHCMIFTSCFLFSRAHKHFCYHFLCRRIHFIFIQWTCVCEWMGKKVRKVALCKMVKEKCGFFVRNVWIWYEVKESWKHIENERWTVCVLVVCVRIWYSDKKYESFSQENSAKHHVPCFRSLLVLFCHLVYDIYNSLLVGWCILSCFCGSSPRFHVHITLNGKVHMITIIQTRVWCNCIYMIWCA